MAIDNIADSLISQQVNGNHDFYHTKVWLNNKSVEKFLGLFHVFVLYYIL